MEGMSLGGELVLVSACLTVTPLITNGPEHTHTQRRDFSIFRHSWRGSDQFAICQKTDDQCHLVRIVRVSIMMFKDVKIP
jgi:hypothetical protein